MKSKINNYSRFNRIQAAFLLLALLGSSMVFATRSNIQVARADEGDIKPVVIYPEAFAESVPASEVPPDLIKNGERKPVSSGNLGNAPDSADSLSIDDGSGEEYEFPMLPLPKGENPVNSLAAPEDLSATGPVMEADAQQALNMPASLLSFEGNSFQDNLNAGFGQLSPPDTNGDVGPNHYVQMTNLLVRVWDKSGNPLTAPFKLSSLFTPLGGQCAAPDAGDPIVLYDPLADRWLLSQFAFASLSSPPYHECIAISKTGDPTGAYYLYDFVTPGNEFPDYPKLGVWPDGYYMTVNQFTNGGPFNGTGAYAFNRAKMLVGDPTASLIYFNLNLASHPEAIGGMLPSDFDGLIAPPAGRPNTFAYFLATEFGDAIDGLRLFDFHVDFANPFNSTFTERSESPVPVAAFDPRSPSGRNDIQQPPPATNSNALDSISDRLMYRLQYRNFGNYESLVTNHTVNVSGGTTTTTYRAGIRYYQLTNPGGPYSVLEQATYSPDTNSRWMGSAATDNQGNLAVGFSVSSLTTFPSIRYAGRLASDPPGGLFQGENEIIAGTGVQRSTGGRWGDYSALSVDPADDCTFWFTTEYYTLASQQASTVGWLTRIGAFKFPSCTPSEQGTLQGTVTDALSSAPISGVTIQISNGFSVSTDAGGSYTRNLAPGSYTATASKFGYQPATATVTIVNGATTVQDFSLTPLPVMAADSSTLVSEGFTPPNGGLDPAETVTVNFTLKNIGPGNTVNLVATLLSTGGVTNPDGPVTYGVVPGNGGTGTRPITFTVDSSLTCGSTLVATLHLQDGTLDLGNVTFTFNLGAKTIMFSENFDGVIAPALPAGWTAIVQVGLGTNNWRTVTTSPDTMPNVAFVPDTNTVHDVRLESPVFAVGLSGAQISFRNNYITESGFDGGVLEISVNNGSFTDIIAAGGSFVSGGYNRTLSTGFSNPLPGRQAWSGNSNGYINTVVNLPDAAAGQNVQLRWRFGSDSSVSASGWRVDSIQVATGYTCAYNIKPAGFALVSESFVPGNGALDPGEAVSMDFTLRNIGSLSTSDLKATLRNSGGVTNSSGTQTYGVLASGGGTGTENFTFRVDPSLACGAMVTATFDLYEGLFNLGTATYNIPTSTTVISLDENFDGASAPALPAGWTAIVASGNASNNWRTVTTSPDTSPNAAFVPDPNTVHDIRLVSPVFGVTSSTAQLTFRNNYATEAGFDGGVLEVSINGGPFTDILAAGGSFVSGGYNRTLSTGFSNPLPGRQAWSGSSGGYITTVVNLPAAANGANVQLRWRMGSDSSVSSTGWRVDSIQVFGGSLCDSNTSPTVTVSPASQTVQYSDPITSVTISAVDSYLDLPFTLSTEWNSNGGAFTSGLPAWLSTADNSCSQNGGLATCTWALSGNALIAPGIYVMRATVTDSQGASAYQDITITVVQEDARATYTGALYVSTASASSSNATVTLAATIQDISVTSDAAGDMYPGDIRNATVTFIDRDTNTVISGCSNLPVGLANPNDLQTGTATCNWNVTISGDAQQFTVGILAGNYYARNASTDNTVVTVAKPLASSFISGGGYLVLTNPAGMFAGDVGSKNNFGFNVKYNKKGTNLQGNINVIVRRTEVDGVHVYQIKGNVMTSLSVQVGSGTATFNGKASIMDITNPLAPVPVDGNATLQVTMVDNGDPGTSDTIGITVWNKNGGLWFASNWNGVKTIEQVLNGGNIVVR